MTKLKENTLLREIPQNLLLDEKVVHTANATQPVLNAMLNWVEKINYRMNVEQLPDEIIEHLLWENHITYNEGVVLAGTREQKIRLIQSAVELHRIKGTPAALELVFSLLDVSCKTKEWFEYNGNPYHFKLDLQITDRGLSDDTIKLLEMLVYEFKNVRSHLENLNINYTSRSKTYIASAVLTGEEITIYPFAIRSLSSHTKVKTIAANNGLEVMTLYPEGGN